MNSTPKSERQVNQPGKDFLPVKRREQDREGSSDQWRKYGQAPRGLRQREAGR